MRTIVLVAIFYLLCLHCVRAQPDPVGGTAPIPTDSGQYYLQTGQAYFDQTQYSLAARDWERALAFSPNSNIVKMRLASVYVKLKKNVDAIRIMEEVAYNGDTTAALELAKIYDNYSQWQKSIQLFQQLKDQYPGWAGAEIILGRDYFQLGRYQEAAAILEPAAARREDAAMFYLLGICYKELHQKSRAIDYLTRALVLGDSMPEHFYQISQAWKDSGNIRQSAVWYVRALDHGFQPSESQLLNMAYYYIDEKIYSPAMRIYATMLARKPKDATLLDEAASLCYTAGYLDAAIDYWDRLREIEPENWQALYMIGKAKIDRGEEKEGEQLCNYAIKKDPRLKSMRQAHIFH